MAAIYFNNGISIEQVFHFHYYYETLVYALNQKKKTTFGIKSGYDNDCFTSKNNASIII